MLAARRDTSDYTDEALGVAPHNAHQLKVLLIDAQPLFAEALAATLKRIWPNVSAVCAHSFEDGLEQIRSYGADVIVANAESLQGHLERLIRTAAPAPVIATANSIENDKVFRTLAAGARGYLPKTMSGEALGCAIHVALSGGVCMPPQSVAAALGRERSRAPRGSRESEILQHLARGESNKVIARELGLSVATVKLHVQNILRSTGARNRVEAIVNARKMGLLSG